MQDWAALIQVIGVVLVGLGGRELIVGWYNKRTGKAAEEKARVKETLDDNDRLRDKLEHQYSVNRISKEYASQLRRILIEKGVPVAEIPPWPKER